MGPGSSLSCDIKLNTKLTAEQRNRFQNPREIQQLLGDAKTIAMVGLSAKPERPSNFVASFLLSEGYKVIPVNPRAEEILGQKSYPDSSVG